MKGTMRMEYQRFTAKTKNEALTAACITFGVTSDRIDYKVETEGSSGFFGFGSKDAVILARVKEEAGEEAKSGLDEAAKAEEAPAKNAGPRIKTAEEIEAARGFGFRYRQQRTATEFCTCCP